MCGLFGSHKGHKIITSSELKKINDKVISESKLFLKEVMDLGKMKKYLTAREYVDSRVKTKITEIKKLVMGMYEVGL